jgi:hypothetical protein
MIVQASDHRLTTFEAYRQMGLGTDQRRYDEVAWMQRLLGIEAPLELLSSNPEKAAALDRAGVSIRRVHPLPSAPTPWNRHYIAAKSRSGHSLQPGREEARAELPERVERYEPRAACGVPSLVDMASYLLPIRVGADEPAWFRVHAYFDLEAGGERVVLSHRRDPEAAPLASLQRESLFDRFSLAEESPSRRRWRRTLREIVSSGAGAVLFRGAEGFGSEGLAVDEPASAEDVESTLLASHLPGRGKLGSEDAWLAPLLAARGVRVEAAG